MESVGDGYGAKHWERWKKKKHTRLAERKKWERKKKKEKGGERKNSCLMNEEGIVIFNIEVLLFTILVFLLNHFC